MAQSLPLISYPYDTMAPESMRGQSRENTGNSMVVSSRGFHAAVFTQYFGLHVPDPRDGAVRFGLIDLQSFLQPAQLLNR